MALRVLKSRNKKRKFNFTDGAIEDDEEEEEPVHALDLRIGKAAESITIFDEENVLALGLAPGPDRIRKKHLSERFCPYTNNNNASTPSSTSAPSRTDSPSTSSIPNEAERNPSEQLRNNSNSNNSNNLINTEEEQQNRLNKEKDWLRNFRQFQSSSNNLNRDSNWGQRLNEVPNRSSGSIGYRARGFASPGQDCCVTGCNHPHCSHARAAGGYATPGPSPHHRGPHHHLPSSQENLNNARPWSTMKEEPMSPLPHHAVDRRHEPPPLAPLGPLNHPPAAPMLQNRFDHPPYFLPPFPGGHDLMRAKNFFQHPHHRSQQLLMAAAAHQRQQQQQQQQYKMSTESLRKKLFSMQNDNCCVKPNNYLSENFFAQQRQMMAASGPPPLLPFEGRTAAGTPVIKQEPNTSHTRHSSAEDRGTPSTTWPPTQASFNMGTTEVKTEQKDDEESREKFNPDKLRSTFLWHVLQRHSTQRVTAPDDSSFTEIDDRLKSIEQASGLYNNRNGEKSRRTPSSHIDLSSPERVVDNRSQYYQGEPSPAPTPLHPCSRQPMDPHLHPHHSHHHLLSKLTEDEEREKQLNGGFDYDKLEKRKFFRENLPNAHSPASSMDDTGGVASPYSVTSPYMSQGDASGKRGRPRKHAPKVPHPPIYVFIRNLLHNRFYNPRVVSWVNETYGIFRVNNTNDFARTWGLMKTNRGVKMNYEKLSRAMRYHYGSIKQGRKGHLAMVKEKRLFYRFGELAINWRPEEVHVKRCERHELCKQSLCLWTKE